ncbi:Zonular occludens toxin (Zot) [Vibrio sp. THAF190c]|nr:Zonular occludens toxin (Zot) [Vibrio sp. THAF190c]QFT09744.1 Zonular occludens toxin (Zot) [Vibrio sp. THAF190c]QFT09752.1 Zonular occludens toxin (Zot) [Vibrio sp. THAF190c]
MIYLRTGLPGASKSLNSLREIVNSHNPERPYFYNNIKLLMLDMDVCRSFSGWFYGWFFPNLKDKALKRKLTKILKPIHKDGDFVTLDDVPFLRNHFDSHNHFSTWLHWVNKVYDKKQLVQLNNLLDCMTDEQKNSADAWETVKVCNLHFTHFDDPNAWFELPTTSVILIDECQDFFPPRPVGSRKPEAIARLEKHRHGGYDIHFITQHPTFADQNLRKLVGRHVHYHNPFGGKQITRFESSKCIDPDNYHDKKQCKKKAMTHDTKFYGVYWSAEIHTHKFQFPKILLAGLLAIFLCLYSVYSVYSFIDSQANPETEVSAPEIEQGANVVLPTQEPAADTIPVDSSLNEYIESISKGVYINGSVMSQGHIEYAFYRPEDDAVFHPSDVGIVVEPIAPCLANLIVGDVRKPIMCNPFYVRVPVDDEEDEEEFNSLFGDSDGDEPRRDKRT